MIKTDWDTSAADLRWW